MKSQIEKDREKKIVGIIRAELALPDSFTDAEILEMTEGTVLFAVVRLRLIMAEIKNDILDALKRRGKQ